MWQIGNAQATTEVDGRDLCGLVDTEFGDDVTKQTDDAMGGDLEPRDVEDLRADMAVQSDEAEVVGLEDPPHRRHRRTAGQRQAELLVLVRGRDELVGVGFHADGDADQDILHHPGLAGDGVEPFDLGHRVQYHVTDAGFHRRGQLGHRFVVAMQRDPLRREIRVQRHGEFTAAAHVQRQALLVDPAGYLAAQERFGRIPDVLAAAERFGHVVAP